MGRPPLTKLESDVSLIYEARSSSSLLVAGVARGLTTQGGRLVRPAENCWHMVVVRQGGEASMRLVGPWTGAGVASYGEGAEILWIRFRLGTFMPGQPVTGLRDQETLLPAATGHSVWLNDAAWPLPGIDDVDAFVERLRRAGVLTHDPLVQDLLHEPGSGLAPRTERHRLLRATGLPLRHIRQVERAQQAAALLGQGVPIPETMFRLGYFDQPHLTRALRRWVGHTPGQLLRAGEEHLPLRTRPLDAPSLH
ncbi:AraC family transcriptional regulator [Deinococcus metallilatus]|nr:AraC family transcriptional regulator [Deinococcus metallilatus]